MIEMLGKFLGRIRPQILLAIALLGVIAVYAMHTDHTDVSSVAVAGMIAVSMKILEAD
jgi:TctA family transporter